jgi:hypothetical protein
MNTQQLLQIKKQAQDCYNLGELDKSMLLFQQVLNADPTDVDSIQKIAHTLHSSTQFVKLHNHYIVCAKNLFSIDNKLAIEMLDHAEKLFPGSTAMHRNTLLRIQSESSNTVKPLKQVDSIKPGEAINIESTQIYLPQINKNISTDKQNKLKSLINLVIENSKEFESKQRMDLQHVITEMINIINSCATQIYDLEYDLRTANDEIRAYKSRP